VQITWTGSVIVLVISQESRNRERAGRAGISRRGQEIEGVGMAKEREHEVVRSQGVVETTGNPAQLESSKDGYIRAGGSKSRH